MKMIKKLLWIAGLFLAPCTQAQQCPQPVFPLDGQTDIAVDATISWTPVTGVTAYQVTLGTSFRGTDLATLTSTGPNTSYTPPRGLPENTTIYVTVYLFNLSQGSAACTDFSFETTDVTTAPGCGAGLLSPANGAANVPVSTDLRWAYSPTATGYNIAAGTSPGASDLLPPTDTDQLQWNPAADLPPETPIYVRIVPFNENGPAGSCTEFSFTTGPLVTLPSCPVLIYPADGTQNVPLSPIISWAPVPGADGYVLSLGSTPTDNDILNAADFGPRTETGVLDFEYNRIYYLTLTAYNSAGVSLGCSQTSFSTGVGCGPYFDSGGNLVDLHPEITFPAQVGICTDRASNTVQATDRADGYRWYSVDSNGRERLLATTPDFTIPEAGTYRHEIYNVYTGPEGDFECMSSQVFEVVISAAPQIERAEVRLGVGTIDITVRVSGGGDYEYALGDAGGPYQDSNLFRGLPLDSYRVYVRDKNGCGTADTLVEPDLTVEGFPRFFTPNGDGANDTWQYIAPPSGISPVVAISIFDRYGNLVSRIGPDDAGWDGTYGGRPLPPSDYWFRAVDRNGGVVQGHFTLKR